MKSILLSLTVAFSMTLVSQAQAAPEEIAKVIMVKGDVFILDKTQRVVAAVTEKSNRRVIKTGLSIFENETVQTKAEGRIKIQFIKDSNEIVLGGNSSLLMQGGKSLNNKVNLELKSGSVRSTVMGRYETPEGYQVKTPNAVAGVRGTVFNVFYDAKVDKTTVATESGKVQLTDARGKNPVMVGAGTFSEAKAGVAPTLPKKLSENPELNKSVKQMSGDGDSKDKGDEKSSGGATTSDKKSDSKSDDKSGEKSAEKTTEKTTAKSDTPPVALAPEPASDDAGRAPASDSGSAKAAPALMGSAAAQTTTAATPTPFAKATTVLDSVKKTVEKATAQQPVGSDAPTIKIPIR